MYTDVFPVVKMEPHGTRSGMVIHLRLLKDVGLGVLGLSKGRKLSWKGQIQKPWGSNRDDS